MTIVVDGHGLRLDGVTVLRNRIAVLRGITLHFQPGQLTALAGPNGAGKSSLLLALLGRLPSRGSITWDGAPVAALTPAQRARIIAWVPQRSHLRAPLRVSRVVASGAAPVGFFSRGKHAAVREAVQQALVAADVTHLAERAFTALSCGEQQRVLIARALVTGAPVLLCDEPTAGLDPRQALSMLALLQRLAREGRTIVAAMHSLAEVQRSADRVIVLHGGVVAADGTPAEVLTTANLGPIYGIEPDPTLDFSVRLLASSRDQS